MEQADDASDEGESRQAAGGGAARICSLPSGGRTQRKRSEHSVQERKPTTARDTEAAIFAHEVANPLAGVSACLRFLESAIPNRQVHDAALINTVRAAGREVDRLVVLLNQFRARSTRQCLNLVKSHLGRLLEEVLDSQKQLYLSAGVTIRLEPDPGCPPIEIDESKIKQVVLNLCKNAVEAMSNGGRLTVKCYPSANAVVLEVSDTGVGIPAGRDVFHLPHTTKINGSGLGLRVVEEIVAAHGGTIGYESESRSGTTFRILFPAAV